MDIIGAYDVLDVMLVKAKNEEDFDKLTIMMIRMAWQAFIRMIYEEGYIIADRTVSEEYVKKG